MLPVYSGKDKCVSLDRIHFGLDKSSLWQQVSLALHRFAGGWISAFHHTWVCFCSLSSSTSCEDWFKDSLSAVSSLLYAGGCDSPMVMCCLIWRGFKYLQVFPGLHCLKCWQWFFLSSLVCLFLPRSYRQRAQRLSEIHKDQPGHPVNRTVYWINYILRHNGAQHLRAAVYSISFYQYFLLDIAFVVLVSAALLYYILARITKFICKQSKLLWSNGEHSAVNGHYQNGIPNGKYRRNGHVRHEKKVKWTNCPCQVVMNQISNQILSL